MMNRREMVKMVLIGMLAIFMVGCTTTDNEANTEKNYSNETAEFLAGYMEAEFILDREQDITFPGTSALLKQYSDLEFDLTGLDQSKYNYKGFIKGICAAIYDRGYCLKYNKTSEELSLAESIKSYVDSYESEILPTLTTVSSDSNEITLDQGKDMLRTYVKENIGSVDNVEYELFDKTHLEGRVYIKGELAYMLALQLDTGEIECEKLKSEQTNAPKINYDPCLDCGDPVKSGNQLQLCDTCSNNYTFCSGGCGELIPSDREWCDDMTCGAN